MGENIFEKIKRADDQGREYWSSRDLAKVLEYADYRNFLTAVNKAKTACENSGEVIHNHFVDADEMVQIGSGAEKSVDTIFLSRYACYLIVQNSDPTKVVVAKGQTYFTIQTRRQENADNLVEDNKRVFLREEMKKHNVSLTHTASSAGVEDFAIFQNHGYIRHLPLPLYYPDRRFGGEAQEKIRLGIRHHRSRQRRPRLQHRPLQTAPQIQVADAARDVSSFLLIFCKSGIILNIKNKKLAGIDKNKK